VCFAVWPDLFPTLAVVTWPGCGPGFPYSSRAAWLFVTAMQRPTARTHDGGGVLVITALTEPTTERRGCNPQSLGRQVATR
jgi:hypothetical protein